MTLLIIFSVNVHNHTLRTVMVISTVINNNEVHFFLNLRQGVRWTDWFGGGGRHSQVHSVAQTSMAKTIPFWTTLQPAYLAKWDTCNFLWIQKSVNVTVLANKAKKYAHLRGKFPVILELPRTMTSRFILFTNCPL